MDELPAWYFHTLWKKYVDYVEEESKKTKKQREEEAMGRAFSEIV